MSKKDHSHMDPSNTRRQSYQDQPERGLQHDIGEILALAAANEAANKTTDSSTAREMLLATMKTKQLEQQKQAVEAAMKRQQSSPFHQAKGSARYSDAEVAELIDSLRKRDAAVENVREQLHAERQQFEQELRAVRGSLHSQAVDARETAHMLMNRIEALDYMGHHRGRTRTEYDKYTAEHAAKDIVAAARKGVEEVETLYLSSRQRLERQTFLAKEHIKELGLAAEAAATQRNASLELSEVREALRADHARRFALLKDRVRRHVEAELRTAFREEFFTKNRVQAIIAETIRGKVTPIVAEALGPKLKELVTARVDERFEDEKAAAAKSVGRLVAVQRTLIERTEAAKAAAVALEEVQAREANYTELFTELRSATTELARGHVTEKMQAQKEAEALEAELSAARAKRQKLRQDVKLQAVKQSNSLLEEASIRLLNGSPISRKGVSRGRRNLGAIAEPPPRVVEADAAVAAAAANSLQPELLSNSGFKPPMMNEEISPRELHHSHRHLHENLLLQPVRRGSPRSNSKGSPKKESPPRGPIPASEASLRDLRQVGLMRGVSPSQKIGRNQQQMKATDETKTMRNDYTANEQTVLNEMRTLRRVVR